MSESKSKMEQLAEEFFANKKNANVNQIYVTSDGNVFRAKYYAEDWKRVRPSLTIQTFDRISNQPTEQVEQLSDTDKENDSQSKDESVVEREALIKEHIELFDKKPHHMMGNDKIKALIDEKKAQLAKDEGLEENRENDDSETDSTNQGENPSQSSN